MNRRTLLTAFGAPALAALVLAACGDDSASSDVDRTETTTTAPDTTAAPSSTQPPVGLPHPDGPEDVVIELEWQGGFIGHEYAFKQLPRLVVTGDGSVYTQGPQIEIYPQPLVAPVLVGHIDEQQLQGLLADAQSANLLRQVEYAQPTDMIADAPDTVLTLTTDSGSFEHRAYALGIPAPETDPDREALWTYVQELDAFAIEDHGEQPYSSDAFAIRSMWADAVPPPEGGIVPDEVEWPAEAAGVSLGATAECAIVPASAVGELFADATQITRFVDGTQKYVLLVRPLIPGDRGC